MTLFEFINHYKVTFFLARTCPNFPTSLIKENTHTSLWFRVSERPKKYLLLSAWGTELYGPGPQFFVIWWTWIYTHGIFRSVILVSMLMFWVYLTFSLFFKISFFDFALVRDPKNIFYYQREVENYTDQVLNFLLTDMNIYTWNHPVCSSGQHTYVSGLFNFFFVLQDFIDRFDYFQRIAFQRNLLLIGL